MRFRKWPRSLPVAVDQTKQRPRTHSRFRTQAFRWASRRRTRLDRLMVISTTVAFALLLLFAALARDWVFAAGGQD